MVGLTNLENLVIWHTMNKILFHNWLGEKPNVGFENFKLEIDKGANVDGEDMIN